jgi:hypothetical protein
MNNSANLSSSLNYRSHEGTSNALFEEIKDDESVSFDGNST